MRINDVYLSELKIPFRFTFKHASAARSTTQSLWVKIHTDGATGYGESCPREYVTNESISSAKQFINSILGEVNEIDWDIDTLLLWIKNNESHIDHNPAAWCAVELALLDAMGKHSNQSIEELVGAPEINCPFCYSAIIGDAPQPLFNNWLEQYLQLNMRDFKLKLSGDQSKDQHRIETIVRATDERCRIRVDANNLFNNKNEAVKYCQPFSNSIFAIEEPLKARQFESLIEIADRLQVKMILDESFTAAKDYDSITEKENPWIINIRISKMGGLLRALDAVRIARVRSIPIIIGAHVGETSLLTRAAMCLAHSARDILLAQEGGFGTYFLQNDVCDNSLRFGQNGCISSQQIDNKQYGFGIL